METTRKRLWDSPLLSHPTPSSCMGPRGTGVAETPDLPYLVFLNSSLPLPPSTPPGPNAAATPFLPKNA